MTSLGLFLHLGNGALYQELLEELSNLIDISDWISPWCVASTQYMYAVIIMFITNFSSKMELLSIKE